MDMAASTSTSDMDSSGSSSMLMGMADISMTFFYSRATPLFSTQWTPASTGAYAGTCIFLIFLTVLHRAIRVFGNLFLARERAFLSLGAGNAESGDKQGPLPAPPPSSPQRFHAGKEMARGAAEAISGGVSYLLMVAVMTMNVGYFSSVLAGLFLGGFLFGRYG